MHLCTMDVERLVKIIEEKRKALGMSMADVHKIAFPGTQSTAIQNLKRGTPPNLNTLTKLIDALDLELYIGPKRPPLDSTPFKIAQMIEEQYGDVLEIAGREEEIAEEFYKNNPGYLHELTKFKFGDDRFVTVPRYDAFASAGGGVFNPDTEEPVDRLAFSDKWLAQSGIHAADCLLINARGQSMEPSIWHGDLIMIDQRKTQPQSRKVYAYNDPDNGTRVKRLELSDNLIAVHSDNPDKQAFPSEYHTGEAANAIRQGIIGEVVWSGHKWI